MLVGWLSRFRGDDRAGAGMQRDISKKAWSNLSIDSMREPDCLYLCLMLDGGASDW